MFGILTLARFGRNRHRKVRRPARGRAPGRLARGLRVEPLEERRLLSLTAAGPVHPVNGFPTWFEDSNGVRVELMPYYQGTAPFNNGQPLVPDTLSLAAPPELGNAFSEAIGFGAEAFYWSADATLTVPGGQALLVLAQEAAFPNGPPTDGDQFAFGRMRVRMDAQFAGTYTVTTPYGDLPSFTVTAGPNAINFTNDVGDVPPFAALLLDQNPIGPFLVAANAPPGYLGNPLQPSTVTGSPTGQNVFAITGPFNGPGTSVTLTTDLFTVSGRRFIAEPPVVAQPIADVVVPVNAASTVIDVSGVFTDPDIPRGDVLTLSVTSSNSAVVAASLNPAGTQLTLTYGANQSGSANITLRATDLDGLFVEDVFTATVSPFSNPPSVVPPGIADATAAEDAAPLVIDLSGSFTDPDFANGDVLTFSAVSANPNLAAASVAGAELTLTLRPNANGVTAVTVTATDQAGQSVSDTFSVTVTPVNNDPPIVAAPIVDRTAFVNALPLVIDLAAVFTDPDLPNGDHLSLSATSDTALVAASVTGTKLTLAFQPNSSGVATVTVTATDSTAQTVTDAFTATVAGFSEVEPISALSGLTGNRPSLLDNAVEQVTSADGRFVVFTSQATDLAGPGNDLNGIFFDVFLYDRADQSVTLISRKAGTLQTANGDSLSPMISDDGTKIAFLSTATDLVPGQVDTNAVEDLFLFDTTTGTMSLVSHIPGLPATAGDGAILSATMSADGTAIAFDSLATNLVTLGLANAAFTNPGGRLVAAGAPDAIHGFPAWYQDSNGVAVDLLPYYLGQAPFNNGQVLVPDPMSISAPPEPGNAYSEAIGFGEEAFWWAADAGIDMGVFGRGLLTLAQEAAFMGDASPVFGNQFAFGRIRTRFDIPVDGTYIVAHPFGQIVFPNQVAGDRLFYSNDNGDLYPYQNNRLLSTDPVGPFLVATNAPPGYLGDPALPATVTGSPLGPDRNYFSIRGPFNGPGTDVEFRTDLFTVVGRRYTADKNNAPDVFLWKAAPATPGGVIELVSRAAGSTVETGNGASRNPIIDPSGASVLYTSEATNLVASQNDTNGFTDVFLFNDQLQATALVSGAGGSQTVTANGASQAEAIDAVGAFAVISSTANNLATQLDAGGAIVPVAIQDANLGRDIYLFDAATRGMKLVSHTSGDPHEAANAPSAAPRISADGRFVAFTSTASNVVDGVTDAAAFQDVFLYDGLTDTSELVSHAAGAPTTPANGDSSAPVLSFDGRFVAFESLATNLVGLAVDANSASDIFVLDRAAGAMKLISEIPLAAPGDTPTAGNGASTHPAISADGRSIVFNSIASNLFSSDGNAVSDVFLYSGPIIPAGQHQPTVVLPGIADVTRNEDDAPADIVVDLAGLFTDADIPNDSLTLSFTVAGANANLLTAGLLGTQLTLTVQPNENGVATVSVTATDQAGLKATDTFTVTVNAINDAPTLDVIPDPAAIDEDAGAQIVSLSGIGGGGGLDEASQTLTITATSSDPSLIPNPVVSYTSPNATGSLSFTPAANANGTAVITVTVTDSGGTANGGVNSISQTFTVTVNPVNDAPTVLQPIADRTALGNVPIVIQLGAVFADADIATNGDQLALSVANNNSGLLTADLAGTTLTLTFQPNPAGTATVSITATDLAGANVVDEFIVSIGQPPTAQPIPPVTAAEDSPPAQVDLAGIFSDPDGDPLVLSLVHNNNPGLLTASLQGTVVTLTFAPNQNGAAIVFVMATDPTRLTVTAPIVVNVTPVNDAPVANAQTVAATEDTAAAITLTGSDIDSPVLTYLVVTGPTHGTLNGTAPNLSYTPNANYNGPDSFTFKVNDGALDSAVVTVDITVAAVNDAPVANAQTVSTNEDAAKAIVLTGADVDGDPLTYTVVTGPAHGTLSGTAPNLTYTPNANYNGPDGFTFKVNDGTVDSALATVTITVAPVNDPPVANAQTVSLNEDTSRSVALAGSDVDGDPLTYTVVTPPAHGTLGATAPNLTYTPAANYNGPDSFTFKANDGTVDSAVATVSIAIAPVNDAPVASAQAVTVSEDTPTAVVLVGSDVDGDPLTYTVVTAPLHGTLTGAAPNLNYTPAPDYFGPDSLTFKVNDGLLDSAAGTISIAVNGAPPAATINQAATQPGVAVDGPIHFTATFDDPVTGFDAADLVLGGTAPGPRSATVTQTDAQGMVYDVTVSGMTGRGTVTAQVRAGAAVDRAGHSSTASTSTDNEVFFEPPQVSDNLDPTFAFTGSWGAHPGYRGGALVSLNRAAGTTAAWTMPVTPGRYQVLLTWTAGGAHATNSPFTIFDGGVATARVSVNQRLAPAGVTFDGVNWRSLGTFSIYGNSLAVGLSALAGGSVDADAVRIVRVGDLTPTTTRIVDDGDTLFTTQGSWATATVGFQRDVRRNTRGTGADTATWTFLVEPGQYEVAATWAALTSGAANAPFTVTGATSFTKALNQRVAPNDFTDAGVGWARLGTMTVTGHVLTVRLSDLANGTVTADAIRIQKMVAPGAASAGQSASFGALDAALAALAASGGSPQLPSATATPRRQQAAIDAIFADPGDPLQLA